MLLELTLLMIIMSGLSYMAVNRIRYWAEWQRMIAIPNERSSHVRPTPSGGGLAIVSISLLGLIVAAFLGGLLWATPLSAAVWSYVGSASAIALISWFDDRYTLPSRWRFMVHSLSTLMILWGIGSWQNVVIPILGQVSLGWIGLPITFIWLVGITNIYNFMDGIDGLAGSQAVIAGAGWALIGWWIDEPFILVLGLGIATSSLGFLGHNWSPACIFMGDVGSAFLGFSFAVMPIVAAQYDSRLILIGLFLIWPFVFDATFTILRRLRDGENIFTAHRSHLYQRLVIAGHSHRIVTLLYIGLAMVGLVLALIWFANINSSELALLFILPLLAFGLWLLVINQEQKHLHNGLTTRVSALKTFPESEVASSRIGSLQR